MMDIKKILTLLFSGILIAGIMIGFMLLITLNLAWVFLLGLVLQGAGGYLLVRKDKWLLQLAILHVGPFLFSLLVFKEIEGLQYLSIPLFLSALFGYLLYSRQWPVPQLVLGVFLLLTAGASFVFVPQLITEQLSDNSTVIMPSFSFSDLQGNSYSNESIDGTIVILDFFGTWCRPCIAEMKELEALAPWLKEKEVLLLAINTGQGGDTQQKVAAFATRFPSFHWVYEPDAQTHQALGFTGVPALTVIDQQGRVVFRHEGYNPAENLQGLLMGEIEKLLGAD